MRRPLLSTTILLVGATIFVTWPQALYLATRVPGHDDSLFSIWRLCWIAHALPGGGNLFDANIFYPHERTLALSDATFLEALIAAPFLWMGINKVLVYNLVFLSGIVSSGVGMFVLARYLTRDVAAAMVAALIFAVTPYRIEHFMHLELQWTVWMPLTIWALYRAFDEGTIRWGVLTGLFLWLQFISCVYYGAFLAVIASVLALMLAAARPGDAMRALGPLALGAALAAALTLPYRCPIWPTPARSAHVRPVKSPCSARPGSATSPPRTKTGSGAGAAKPQLATSCTSFPESFRWCWRRSACSTDRAGRRSCF